MNPVEINWLAVLLAAAAYMALGGVWYGTLFSKPWLRAMDLTEEEIEESKGRARQGYLLTAVGALVMSAVLAHWVDYVEAGSAVTGAQTGFWAWLGFVATSSVGSTAFEGRPWTLYFLGAGYHLVALLAMGALLAVWA